MVRTSRARSGRAAVCLAAGVWALGAGTSAWGQAVTYFGTVTGAMPAGRTQVPLSGVAWTPGLPPANGGANVKLSLEWVGRSVAAVNDLPGPADAGTGARPPYTLSGLSIRLLGESSSTGAPFLLDSGPLTFVPEGAGKVPEFRVTGAGDVDVIGAVNFGGTLRVVAQGLATVGLSGAGAMGDLEVVGPVGETANALPQTRVFVGTLQTAGDVRVVSGGLQTTRLAGARSVVVRERAALTLSVAGGFTEAPIAAGVPVRLDGGSLVFATPTGLAGPVTVPDLTVAEGKVGLVRTLAYPVAVQKLTRERGSVLAVVDGPGNGATVTAPDLGLQVGGENPVDAVRFGAQAATPIVPGLVAVNTAGQPIGFVTQDRATGLLSRVTPGGVFNVGGLETFIPAAERGDTIVTTVNATPSGVVRKPTTINALIGGGTTSGAFPLTITSGTIVSDAGSSIALLQRELVLPRDAYFFGSNGTYQIEARTTVAGDWTVATSSTLQLSGGGVTVDKALYVAQGKVRVLGAVQASEAVRVAPYATVEVQDGGLLRTTTLDVRSPLASVDITGGRVEANAVIGDLLLRGGTFAPIPAIGGGSAGVMSPPSPGAGRTGTTTVSGGFVLGTDGVLEMELAGTGPGEFDRLLAGSLSLNGTLRLVLADGYVPKEGDSFPLFGLLGGGAVGTGFTGVEVPPALAAIGFDPAALARSGTLTVIPEPATAGLVLAAVAVAGRRRR